MNNNFFDNSNTNLTSGIIIIGNEILSGRTLDTNTQEISLRLAKIGVILKETRIIPDHHQMIVDTIQDMHSKYNYIFTTGGLGSTHDDITTKAVADAFNLDLVKSKEIQQRIHSKCHHLSNKELAALDKMSYIPYSAKIVHNDITTIPSFYINNVFVMAGSPNVMKEMLKASLPLLQHGKILESRSIDICISELSISDNLRNLQERYPQIEIGSYPFKKDGERCTSIVFKSYDAQILDKAFKEWKKFLNIL